MLQAGGRPLDEIIEQVGTHTDMTFIISVRCFMIQRDKTLCSGSLIQ